MRAVAGQALHQAASSRWGCGVAEGWQLWVECGGRDALRLQDEQLLRGMKSLGVLTAKLGRWTSANPFPSHHAAATLLR